VYYHFTTCGAVKPEVTCEDLRLRPVLLKRIVRIRLRYVLPVVQMLLAVGLYRWSDAWLAAIMRRARGEPYMGSSPGFDLLYSLNAPLWVVHTFYPHLPELLDRVVFVSAIGLLWYWVALNFESLFRIRAVFTFSRPTLRVSSDLLLVVVGFLSGLLLLRELLNFHSPLWWSGWDWLCCLFCGAWFVSLTYFFTRDFIACIRRAKPFRLDG
jgi:hypothetical protein